MRVTAQMPQAQAWTNTAGTNAPATPAPSAPVATDIVPMVAASFKASIDQAMVTPDFAQLGTPIQDLMKKFLAQVVSDLSVHMALNGPAATAASQDKEVTNGIQIPIPSEVGADGTAAGTGAAR